jgi:hypothetical protein
MRRARRSFVALLALLLLAAVGCSADPGGVTLEATGDSNAEAVVEAPSLATFQSLSAQVQTTSLRYEMAMNMESDFMSMNLPMSGAIDGDRMSIAIDMSQISVPGVSSSDMAMLDGARVEMILVPPFVYMNMGGLDGGLFGRDWIAIDVTQSDGADGLLDGLGGMGRDPFGSLHLLEQADSYEEIGTETVRGVDTTHYRLIVNPAKAWDQLDQQGRDALSGSLGDFGATPPDIDLPYDVWLDEQGRARRLSFAMGSDLLDDVAGSTANPAELQLLGDLSLTMTMEIFDYGDPSIAIEAPEGAVDMTDLLGALPD